MIKAIFFDINGTLIDIWTVESDDTVYRVTANFLDYYGVSVAPGELKTLYFELNRAQRCRSGEAFPEFDVVRLFETVIDDAAHASGRAGRRGGKRLAGIAALVFRAASRFKLVPYPGVKAVLDALKKTYRMAAVSDGQTVWAGPELRSTGLAGYFEETVISGACGFRKPDPRMYELALRKMRLSPREVIFVGNDMYRDIYGAKSIGMKTVFFRSNQGDQSDRGAAPDYVIERFEDLPRAVDFLDRAEQDLPLAEGPG